MLKLIAAAPKIQILLAETSHRGVDQSSSYCSNPTKLKLGNSLEVVNDQITVKMMQITKMTMAVAAMGSVPMTDGTRASRRRIRPRAFSLSALSVEE